MNNINRILPNPEQYASCPYDENILEFYKGQFEAAYVLLHPFGRLKNGYAEHVNTAEMLSKHELVQNYESISWQSVIDSTNLNTVSEIDIGLRTNIRGLRKDLENQEYAKALNELTKTSGIWQPGEGELSQFLENDLFEAIKALGHTWLWIGDQFGTERKLHWIDDLIREDEIPVHGCVFAHDHSLLITTHWDSHYSLLCSSLANIEKILATHPFEGFYCTDKTEVYWSVWGI